MFLTKILPQDIQFPAPEQLINNTINEENFCLKNFTIRPSVLACLVPQAESFAQAHLICNENNMKLLEVQSITEMRTLFKFTKQIFGTGGATVIWIEGLWEYEYQEWRKYGTNQSLARSNELNILPKRFVGRDDYCLSIQSYFIGQYELAPMRCYHKCYFYCQYNIQ